MIVKDLKKMEEIVLNNKSLHWDGWTVVNSYPSEKGRLSKFGALFKGAWHIQSRFTPSSVGWEIPNKFVK